MIRWQPETAEWRGSLSVSVYPGGRYAVVMDGRPVFSGTGYMPGPYHDTLAQVADVLAFASYAAGDGRTLAGAGRPFADDLAAMAQDIERDAAA